MRLTLLILVLLLCFVCGCTDLSDDVRRTEDRVTALEGRVTGLEGILNNHIINSEGYSRDLSNLRDRLEQAEDDWEQNEEDDSAGQAQNEAAILALQTQINNVTADIDSLQLQANAVQIQITQLASNESIVQFVDPCGDYPGHYDEIIIKTSSGKLVAYCESGGNQRYLCVLTQGSYRTTDAQQCYFTVNASGQIL